MVFNGIKRLADNYMQIWNADSEGLLDIYADSELIVEYTHLQKIEGIESYKSFLRSIYRSFPDMKITIREISTNKKQQNATVFWEYTGTHKNNVLFGVEPNQQEITVKGMSFLKIADKKIIGEKGIMDNLSLLMQLNP